MELFVIIVILLLLFLPAWFSMRAERAFNREPAGRTLQTPQEFASFYAALHNREKIWGTLIESNKH